GPRARTGDPPKLGADGANPRVQFPVGQVSGSSLRLGGVVDERHSDLVGIRFGAPPDGRENPAGLSGPGSSRDDAHYRLPPVVRGRRVSRIWPAMVRSR